METLDEGDTTGNPILDYLGQATAGESVPGMPVGGPTNKAATQNFLQQSQALQTNYFFSLSGIVEEVLIGLLGVTLVFVGVTAMSGAFAPSISISGKE